jgi:hypothetical protein
MRQHFFVVVLLPFLFLPLLLLLPGAQATYRMGLRTELEASRFCYQRFAPTVWNTFVAALSNVATEDVDAFARKVTLLREQHRTYRAPCTAIARVLGSDFSCPVQASEVMMGPLLMCLNAAHASARLALFESPDRETASAANAQMFGSPEEALTFATDATHYADAMNQAVFKAAQSHVKNNKT